MAYSLNVKDTIVFVFDAGEEQLDGRVRPEAFQLAGTVPLLAEKAVRTAT